MNRARILELADMIECGGIHGLGFSMATFFNDKLPDKSGRGCNTVACIAGWATIMYDLPIGESYSESYLEGARLALELSEHDAYYLFMPEEEEAYDATPQQAARVLRHFADTGIVDWSIIL